MFATSLIAKVTIIFIPFTWTIPIVNLDCDTSGYSGMYHHNTKTVYVCEWEYRGKDAYTAQFSLYHELGHYYWYTLTDSQRSEYTKEYSKAKQFYRDYGKESVQEDFSDGFAVLSLGQHTNFWVQKRINLINKFTLWTTDVQGSHM